MRPHTDILIVGAGPAGLTAGYLLTKAGRDVHVIERDPHYVGGISRTVDYKGYLFDIGGHRFFSKSKEVVDLWNELLPDDFIEHDTPQTRYAAAGRDAKGIVSKVLDTMGRGERAPRSLSA